MPDEQPDSGTLPGSHCCKERCPALDVNGIQAGLVLQQGLHTVHKPTP